MNATTLDDDRPQLTALLRDWLGDTDDGSAERLQDLLRPQLLAAGETLMREGEPGDAMFIVQSGRLRTYVRDDSGAERAVREMGRGQLVGEMALITGEPRSATVVAVRDTVLARLDAEGFRHWLATSPSAALALTRQTVQRLRAGPSQVAWQRPVTMALLPISGGVDAAAFGRTLAHALAAHGRVVTVDAAALDAALGPGSAQSEPGADAARDARIAHWLDVQERSHEMLLLVADATDTAWTGRCCRRADEVLLLADAGAPPALHVSETRYLMQRTRSEAPEILLLLQPADARLPSGTQAWLARRPVSQHLHLRRGHAGDLARLARIQARQAVGLVLAGGGARGFVHLGVLQALQEAGVPVDFVGGTSMGAMMSALIATDRPAADLVAVARHAFRTNPTGDYNLLPMLSLIRGQRMRRAIAATLERISGRPDGAQWRAEDLWLNWFCVASNFSQAREEVLDRGPLDLALRASAAIPGALPPVLRDGDLLCDGGTFNNFPVDVMRRVRGVGHVIGVDLAVPNRRRLPQTEVPSPWVLLWDRLRPGRRRRLRFPSLMSYLMNVTILYSASRGDRARRQADWVLQPPLPRVGMLQWNRLDDIVRQGHAHAREALAKLPPATRRRFGLPESAG